MNDRLLAAYLGISISTTTFGILARSRDGREDYVSPDVAQVLGREPRSFGDWAESVRSAWVA